MSAQQVETIVEPGTDWMLYGSCRSVDPELWYPEKGNGAHARKSKMVCQSCPVIALCLTYALDNGEIYGIWGGLTSEERRKLRRPMLARKAKELAERNETVRRMHLDDRLTQREIAARLGITRQVVWAAIHEDAS